MASEYRYQLTQKAAADLDDIASYMSVELSNPKAASNFMEKLAQTIQETVAFPMSGTLVNNEFVPDVGVRKKVIGNYLMYYLPDPEQKIIYIIRLVYGRRNMDEILRSLEM